MATSAETKDRVFQAVEESGYRPNLLARNLSAKSTQTLGLVVTNTLYHGIYFSELLFHAARMAEEKGRQLLLADGKHSAEEERQAIQYLLDLRCDAIMIYPRFLSVDEIDDIIDAHSQPIMVLNRRLRKNSSHSVWCDHKQTSFNAVAELINAGHQEIAFLTGSMDSPTSVERLAGYKDALSQHGIALNEKLIANGKWTPASGAEGVETLLERGAKFSALVASNDDMAIGAIKALHERGVAVPEQVSVIGFDDIAIAPYTGSGALQRKNSGNRDDSGNYWTADFYARWRGFLTAENLQRKTDPPRLTHCPFAINIVITCHRH